MCHCLWYARGLCLCPYAITPRGFTSPPTQEAVYSFSGFIPTNKHTDKGTKPSDFRTNVVRGLSDKVKVLKFLNKGTVQVQVAPVFINQPRNQKESNTEIRGLSS